MSSAQPFDDDEAEDGAAPGAGLSVVIAADPPDRLDKALARDVPEGMLSRSRLAKLIAEGAVTRDSVPVTELKARVAEGEIYMIALAAPEEIDVTPEAIPLVVVHEDADLIVINKPAGMVVHPAPGSWSGTLVNALLHHCAGSLSGVGGAKRPGIVHRIDKDTSGLLVVAKSDRAHQGLAAQFAAHTLERRYLAVLHGAPNAADPRLRGVKGVSFEPGGVIRVATNLARHRTDRQRQAVVWDEGRRAVTRARVLETFGSAAPEAALVECWLETGRTHQIRVHMTHIGHGLIGDPVYGGNRKLSPKVFGEGAAVANTFSRQALHAATLGFTHPVTGKELRFEADLPSDMAALIDGLRGVAAG